MASFDKYLYDFVLIMLCLYIVEVTDTRIHHHSCSLKGCQDGPGTLKCQACMVGCSGSNCEHNCRGMCDVHGCKRTTGICVRCKPGYYGEMCDRRCPENCSSSINDGIADCDRSTGSCLEHCTPGKTGSHCHQTCPVNCKASVCTKQGGECFLGCKLGWRGAYCNISCNKCLGGRCADDGYCTTNCKPGFYGDLCDKTCSDNGKHCHLTGCDRQTGLCYQCSPGYHGEHCDKECNSNCHKGGDNQRDCDRYDGRCLEDCESGWHGTHCNTPCSENCKRKECYNPHGRCTYGCEDGWYGSHCNKACSANCLSRLCNQHNGHCNTGCMKGFFGKNCEKPCENCDKCDQHTGRCLKCPRGYCGVTCTETCSTNCDGDICDMNGNCTNGCKNNMYHGYMCENKCGQGCLKCDQSTGNCLRIVEIYKGNERFHASSCLNDTGQSIIIVFCLIALHLVSDAP